MNNIFDLINKKKASLSGIKETIKPGDGNNCYIFLPSWKGDNEPFWADWGRHWIKNELGEVQAVCSCNSVSGGRCEICAAIADAKQRWGATDPVVSKMLDEATAGHRILFNVLECKITSTATGPAITIGNPSDVKILELPKTAGLQVFDGIANLQLQGITNPFDFNSIYVFNIIKSGKGKMNTTYQVSCMLKPVSFTPAQVAEIKANIKNLDEFVLDDPANTQKALTALRTTTGDGNIMISNSPAQQMISAPTVNQAQTVAPIVNSLNTVLDDSIPTFEPQTVEQVPVQQASQVPAQAQPAQAPQATVTETSPEQLAQLLQF